jgi:DNA-binding CsgD family transcriptional regulator
MLISTAVMSRLIGEIYDCATDPTNWEQTLEHLAGAIGSQNAQIGLTELPSARTLLMHSYGVTPEWIGTQSRYFGDMFDMWSHVVADVGRPLDEPVAVSRDVPVAKAERNRYLLEWVNPQGIRDSIGLVTVRDPTRIGNIGFGTTEIATDQQLQLARLLAPHIRRAMVISNLLDSASVTTRTLEATLDTCSAAVLIVNSSSGLMHANRAGRALIETGDPLRIDRGFVRASLPLSHGALVQAVAIASESEASLGGAGIGVPMPGRSGAKFVAHVLPLRPFGSSGRHWLFQATAAIFVTPAQADVTVPVDALRTLFDLTAAEGRVLVEIAAGRTPVEAAQEIGIAESTVKTHLSRIFSKTGVGRQADLVALVRSLSMPA